MEASNCQATVKARYRQPSTVRRTYKQLPHMSALRCGAYRNHAPEQDVGPFRDFDKVKHYIQASLWCFHTHCYGHMLQMLSHCICIADA